MGKSILRTREIDLSSKTATVRNRLEINYVVLENLVDFVEARS